MTKQEYIDFWKKTAEDDWNSSEDLFKTRHYLQSLFFAHLTLEKLCKALWIGNNESNDPPRIHNLVFLLKQTKLQLQDSQVDFFFKFNDFQLEGRYPDYQGKLYKAINESTTEQLLKEANEYRLWLLSNLQ